MAMTGLNLILYKKFKTTAGAVRSVSVRIASLGTQRMDTAIWITGLSAGVGGFATGILFSPCSADVGIDMQGVAFNLAAIRLNQSSPIVLSWNHNLDVPHEQIYGTGSGIRLQTERGGYTLFATDDYNSVFAVYHVDNPGEPPTGEIQFQDGTGSPWLRQDGSAVKFSKQVVGTRSVSSSTTFDFTQGNIVQYTLANGPNQLTFTGFRDGGEYTIYLFQPTSGNMGTVTWPGVAKFPGGTKPTLSTTNGALDVLRGTSDGTNIYFDTVALDVS
jgi:hypothetical protein